MLKSMISVQMPSPKKLHQQRKSIINMLISHTDGTNGNNGFNATATPAMPPVNVLFGKTKKATDTATIKFPNNTTNISFT